MGGGGGGGGEKRHQLMKYRYANNQEIKRERNQGRNWAWKCKKMCIFLLLYQHASSGCCMQRNVKRILYNVPTPHVIPKQNT